MKDKEVTQILEDFTKEFKLPYLVEFLQTHVQRLDINQNNDITSIPEALNFLPNLKILCMMFNKNLSSIENLDNLHKLEKLILVRNNFSSLKGLENVTSLKSLDISDNNITKVEGISSLNNLVELNLSSNCITSTKGLELLPNLETLDLSFNKSNSLNIISLKEAPKLKYLNLTFANGIYEFHIKELLDKNISIIHN